MFVSLDIIGLGTKSDQCPVVRGDKHVYVRYCKNGVDQRGYYYHGASELFP